MNETGLPRFWLLAAALLVAGLWLVYALTTNDPVLGEGSARAALSAAATIASVALVTAALGNAILSFAPGIWGPTPNGFQRVVVYGFLACVAAYLTLHYFGYQLSAILTTSAIATAAIALALQPTLGSMIAGMAIHTDRNLHVGDGVMQDGEPVQVIAMSWRVVVGRRADGRITVIPNSKLSDNTIEILPRNAALRREILFSAPITESPQQVCDLVRELVADFSAIDGSLPIMVAPLEIGLKDSARFRISCHVRPWWQASMVEGEIGRRIWYLFQRNRIIATPASGAICAADIAALLPAAAASRAAKEGRLLLFAPDERLILPNDCMGSHFVLLRGDAVYFGNFTQLSEIETIGAPLWVQKPGRIAAIRGVAEELAGVIGPYAELAVNRAAETAPDFEQLCRTTALEIDDAGQRAMFLQKVLPEEVSRVTPGSLLETHRDASGNLVCRFGLRAATEVAILAIPPGIIPERLLAS